MSLPPLFPKATTAGIVKTSDGDRVVASSRRPDGTYRKELKIRPGYTPDEDVTRYRSTRSAESDARIAIKGKIPGLTPPVQAAMLGSVGLKLTKAQKKNSKRKEKRRDGAEGEEEESEDEEPDRNGNGIGKSEEVPDSWESGDEEATIAKKVEVVEVKTEEVKVVEESSRVRALKKKLRQAEQLRERETMGLYLPPAEREKVKGIPALEEEISKLAI